MPVADFADLEEGNPFADEEHADFAQFALETQSAEGAATPAPTPKSSKPIVGIIYPPPEVRSKSVVEINGRNNQANTMNPLIYRYRRQNCDLRGEKWSRI